MINLKLLDMDVGVPCYSHLHKNGVGAIAAVGAAASLIGAGVSAYSQSKTNESNEAINQQKLDFDKWAIAEQARLNSPVNQAEQYEQAGFSKYAMLGNLNSGVGLQSSSQMTPMQNPVQPGMFDKLADQLYSYERMKGDVAQVKSSTAKNDAETVNIMAENQYAHEFFKSRAEEQAQRAKLTGNQQEYQRIQNELMQDSFQYQVNQFALQNKLTEAQIDSVAADASLTAWNALSAQKNYEWIDKLKSAELDEILARIATEYTKQELNREQAKAAVQSAFMMNEQGKLSKSERSRLDRTADAYVDEMTSNAALAKWKSISQGIDAANNFDPYNWNVFKAWTEGKSTKPAAAVGAFGHFMNKVTPKFGFGK